MKSFNTEDVFLITDKGLTESSLTDRVVSVLRQNKVTYEVFDDVEINPQVQAAFVSRARA